MKPGDRIPRWPKLCGADCELANFFAGGVRRGGTGFEASRALLRRISGFPRYLREESGSYATERSWQSKVYGCGDSSASGSRWLDRDADSQDWGRRFLASNGGCAYIDLSHLEICAPETLSAWDHLAAMRAKLNLVRMAMDAVDAALPRGIRIQVLANNSDGLGNSYGSHANFLVSRALWNDIFLRKPHYLQYLAAYQVSSIIFTGQGKVGAENGAPEVRYQLSQRADFFETLTGEQTTFRRPIVNSRDETLCGKPAGEANPAAPARLHVIFFDHALAQPAALLRIGVMQLILAMMEARFVNPRLMLDDPLEALCRYNRDPSLQAEARLASGRRVRAAELQFLFLAEAEKFAAMGGFQGYVPRYAEILALWRDTAAKLERRDLDAVAGRLDWVIKLKLIERALSSRPSLDWESPQTKMLDQVYSSLGDDGLFRQLESAGETERVVEDSQIRHFERNPPSDTRAWTRAMLLRVADPETVHSVDWASLTFRLRERHSWPSYRDVALANPLSFTKRQMEPVFGAADSFSELLDAIEESSAGDGAAALQTVAEAVSGTSTETGTIHERRVQQ